MRIPRVHQTAKAAVEQRLSRAVDSTAHDWNTARRGLDQDDSEPFAGAGHDENVRQIVVRDLFGFRDAPGENHVAGHPKSCGFRLKPRAVVTLPNNEIFEGGKAFEQFGHELD